MDGFTSRYKIEKVNQSIIENFSFALRFSSEVFDVKSSRGIYAIHTMHGVATVV